MSPDVDSVTTWAALFERDGYLVVRGLWPADEAAAVRDHYMQIHAERTIAGFDDGLPDTDILRTYPRLVHPHRSDPPRAAARAVGRPVRNFPRQTRGALEWLR